ncbi:TolC family protein [Zoogloea sp. 1C4]|uniref:TolC family protein n=1 Tax=Zoogloea sp. 1C4 TaxID=2570190 RepID=UPI0012921BA2|nr:TolC family protein [Zoogloea sp. 1C4]
MIRHLAPALLLALAATAQAQTPGASLESLLDYARSRNPEYAAMRYEAEAAAERIVPAGALPDPKFRTELRDITRMGEQNPSVLPARVGSTRYLLMQDVPWLGKRELKREIAELDARAADGRATGTWAELSARIKTAYAQYQYIHHNTALTRELLDLSTRLEKVAQARYAGGLAAQQDVIRAQIEQTGMRTELLSLDNEDRQARARLNTLLARPASAPLEAPTRLRPLPPPAALDAAALEARVRARNPQLFADEAKVRAAEKGRELAYKNRYPDFTLGVSPIQYQGSVKEWELMVELNLPLQQGSRRAQEREAEAMLSAARARLDATANQALGELEGQRSAFEAARRTEALIATSLLPQADLSFKSALAAYENGKVDFATLMDAQRQIRIARQSRIKAQFEAQMSLAEIERIVGEDL